MLRVLQWLSRLVPRWRRDDWLREWQGELAAGTGPQPSRTGLAAGATAHILWLWSHEWSLDMIRSDIRYAFRGIARAPGFAAASVLALALGIGATAAMFSVIDAVLLRSFPYPQADRLVVVWPEVSVSPRAIHTARIEGSHAALFESLGAYSGWSFTLTGGEQAEMVDGARVTHELLQALRARPLHGRLLQPGDDEPGRTNVALLSEGLWRRRFNADPAAIGRTLFVGGVPHQMIGVLPSTFDFPADRSDLWLPITIDPAGDDYNANFAVRIGRLAPGVSRLSVEQQLRAEALSRRQERPAASVDRLLEAARVVPLRDHFVGEARAPLLMLLGAVSLLLILSCANVANLMLTRASARRSEMALRTALGADRLRLVRQLLVENLVLAAAGGLAGAAIAYGLVRTISPLAPAGIPNLSEASIDARVLTVVALTAIACALIFGLAPGARVARADLRPLLGGRGAGGSQLGGRLRAIFAFTQVAIAMLLAVSAALLGRSYMNLRDIDPGFIPDKILTMRVSAPSFGYRETSQVRELYRTLLDRVKALPDTESAGAIQLMPLTLSNWNPRVVIEGVAGADQYQLDINWRTVTPDYFAAMRIPLKRGRLLTEADEHNALPVTVVNEAFVRTVLRGADPIGRRIRTGFEPRGTWATVVGIVGDVRQHAMAQTPNPEMYRPFAQHPVRTMRLLIRTTGEPVDTAATVRAAIATIDTDIVIADIEPLTAIVDRALGGTKLPLFLAGTLALVALAIGVVGIAGVIAFDVAQRHAEIGIRLALGETPGRIRRAFLMRAAKLGLAGMAAGAAASFGAGKLLEAMLYGVTSTDPTVILATAVICMAAVLVASYVPARRASRLDPLLMLRGD